MKKHQMLNWSPKKAGNTNGPLFMAGGVIMEV